MKKRIISLILAAVLCLSLLPVSAMATADGLPTIEGRYHITVYAEHTLAYAYYPAAGELHSYLCGGEWVVIEEGAQRAMNLDPTVPPEHEYHMESILVKDADGNEVPLQYGGFSFIMPESDVSVWVNYGTDEITEHAVFVETVGEGSVAAVKKDPDPNHFPAPGQILYVPAEKGAAGEEILLNVQMTEGNELAYLLVTDGSGSELLRTAYTGEETECSFTFTMPDDVVRVSAVFRPRGANKEYQISKAVTGGSLNFHTSSSESVSSSRAGETIYMDWVTGDIGLPSFNPLQLYTMDVLVTDSFGNPVPVEDDSFVMPPTDVTVRAIIRKVTGYKIFFDVEGGRMSASYDIFYHGNGGVIDGPVGGERVTLDWIADGYDPLSAHPDVFCLDYLIVKDACGNVIPTDGLSFRMPYSDVYVSAVIKHKSNFDDTYRVILSPGKGSGSPIVYESSYGVPRMEALEYDFYLNEFGSLEDFGNPDAYGSPGFMLHQDSCPDSFTAPTGYVFDGWEGTDDNQFGENTLTSKETVFTAKWKPDDSIPDATYKVTVEPLVYHGNGTGTITLRLNEDTLGKELSGDSYIYPTTVWYRMDRDKVIKVFDLSFNDYRDIAIPWVKNVLNWCISDQLDEDNPSTDVGVSIDPYQFSNIAPGIYRAGDIYPVTSILYEDNDGKQIAGVVLSGPTLIVSGYSLATKAWTVTAPEYTDIPVRFDTLYLGNTPLFDGKGSYGWAEGIRFEWEGGTLKNDRGDELPFRVDSSAHTQVGMSGSSDVLTSESDEFNIPIWIDPDDYYAAEEGTYTGTLHYRAYYHTDGAVVEYTGDENGIALTVQVKDDREYYRLEGDCVRFYDTDTFPIGMACEGQTVQVFLDEDAIPAGYGFGGALEAEVLEVDDEELTFDAHDDDNKWAVFTMPGHDVRVSARLEPIVLQGQTFTYCFLNADGEELQSGEVSQGVTPEYTGETPTLDEDEGYTYAFAGWTPEVGPAEADTTYIATYTATPKEYTVTFLDEDGTELKSSTLAYGDMPAEPLSPRKDSTARYSYSFSGWSPAVGRVTGPATYTATYTQTVNKYKVWFLDEDGTLLQTVKAAYGTKPEYTGETPTKDSDEYFTYSFAGWSPRVGMVTGEAIYRAVYTATGVPVEITAEADPAAGGTITGAGTQEAGKPVTLMAASNRGYVFVNWTENGEEVGTDAVYTLTPWADGALTAHFEPAYTLTFEPGMAGGAAVPGDTAVVTSADEGVWADTAEEAADWQFYEAEGIDGTVVWFMYPPCFYTAPEGYVFAGWRLEGKDFNYGTGRWPVTGSGTVTAQWGRVYGITAQAMAQDFAAWDSVPETAPEGQRVDTVFSISTEAYEAGWRPAKLVVTDENGEETEITETADGAELADVTPTEADGRMVYTPSFDMPASDVSVAAVFRLGYGLSGSYVCFFQEDSIDPITSSIAGRRVTVSVDTDLFPDGYWFTGAYESAQVTVEVDELGDGSFTMPAEAVTVNAVLAEQEDCAVTLADDTPVTLPENVADLLSGSELFDFDACTMDLNGDGAADVLIDLLENTAQRLAGADAITENVTVSLDSIGLFRYNSVTFIFSTAQTGPITITRQPADVAVLPGETASTTVAAEGEGLTYQWYGRDANGREFKSGLKGDTYSVTMVNGKSGRTVWCVITDKDGNTATTREAVLNAAYPEDYFEPSVMISDDSLVALGGTASVTAEATGYGELTYQWYFIDKGSEKQSKSSIRSDTYSVEMKCSRDGRTVWCVVTDAWGSSAVSEERVIGFDRPGGYEAPAVSVRADSVNTDVDEGELAFVTIDAAGPDGTAEGLKYQWYLLNPGREKWSRSSYTGDTYSVMMVPAKSGRQVKCVVTDAYGGKTESEVFTLNVVIPEDCAAPEIVTQPASVAVARGELASATVVAEGVELTYQWYLRANESASWSKSSLTGDTYSVKMYPSKSGRQVKCVVTDKYGRCVTSEIATLTMEP